MADAEAVVAGLPRGAARYIGLVLNKRGALRAVVTAVDEVGVVCAASDTFGVRNQGQTIGPSLDMACAVMLFCSERSTPATATIAVAFGSHLELPDAPARALANVRLLPDARPPQTE